MKTILFLILALISLVVNSPYGVERLQKNKERMEKIKKCVNENGSETLKKALNEFEGFSIDKFLIDNGISLNSQDLELVKDCRKKTIYA